VLCTHVRTLSYVHKQLLSVVRTSAWFFVWFNIWRLTCIAFLPIALHCSGVLYYTYNIICILYNIPFKFILIHFAFNRRWSCVFHPGNLVLRFPVPWIPLMRFGPAFSSLAFSASPSPNILVGGTSTGISPPILLRTFGYSRPILVALRSLSLKPFSVGYKTPPIRCSQAGGQSAHKARPPNLELALTPLRSTLWRWSSSPVTICLVQNLMKPVTFVIHLALVRVTRNVLKLRGTMLLGKYWMHIGMKVSNRCSIIAVVSLYPPCYPRRNVHSAFLSIKLIL